jgi:hypothetical protein
LLNFNFNQSLSHFNRSLHHFIIIDPNFNLQASRSFHFNSREAPNANVAQEEQAPAPAAAVAPCVVCLVNPKDTLFLPCGHVCCCANCAAIIEAQGNDGEEDGVYLCPICRGQVTHKHRLFFA